MARLEELRRKITSVEQLHSVVKTMKAMAAVNIRQYEQAVDSLQDYHRTIEFGLQAVLSSGRAAAPGPREGGSGQTGGIVFGSDQGMCGRFNEQIAQHAHRTLKDRSADRSAPRFFAVGQRVIGLLESMQNPVEGDLALPSSILGVTERVRHLIEVIEDWLVRRGVGEVILFYNEHARGSYRPTSRRILPLDADWLDRLRQRRWPTRCLPSFRMDPDRLLPCLIRQYFFVSLYRAFAESLAAENASRLQAMQAAEKNIEERRDDLDMQFRRVRQSAITEQLLDVVVGYEALAS